MTASTLPVCNQDFMNTMSSTTFEKELATIQASLEAKATLGSITDFRKEIEEQFPSTKPSAISARRKPDALGSSWHPPNSTAAGNITRSARRRNMADSISLSLHGTTEKSEPKPRRSLSRSRPRVPPKGEASPPKEKSKTNTEHNDKDASPRRQRPPSRTRASYPPLPHHHPSSTDASATIPPTQNIGAAGPRRQTSTTRGGKGQEEGKRASVTMGERGVQNSNHHQRRSHSEQPRRRREGRATTAASPRRRKTEQIVSSPAANAERRDSSKLPPRKPPSKTGSGLSRQSQSSISKDSGSVQSGRSNSSLTLSPKVQKDTPPEVAVPITPPETKPVEVPAESSDNEADSDIDSVDAETMGMEMKMFSNMSFTNEWEVKPKSMRPVLDTEKARMMSSPPEKKRRGKKPKPAEHKK